MHKSDFSLIHRLRVRWSECDSHGIVFNANYFVYFDIAAYDWQRAVGEGLADYPDFVTAHAECDFLRSAKFDEDLDIAIRCSKIGNKSLRFETAVFLGDELINRGALTYIHVLKGTTQTAPLDETVIARIMEYERVCPVRGGSSHPSPQPANATS